MPQRKRAIHHLALQDYLDGLTLTQIAGKYNVSRATVEGWRAKQGWYEARLQLEEKIKNSIFEKIGEKIEKNTENFLEATSIITKMCVERLKVLYEQKIHEETDDIFFWCKVLLMSSQIQKNSHPTIPQDLAERILLEIENIKKVGKNDE